MINWSKNRIAAFQDTLLAWYDQEKRHLPWRQDHDPYHVWISEIMLQQTQVKTVIPYYERFMKRFPTIEALANAAENDLMKMWEGLGYYSRARNLQKAAKQVVFDYEGKWPNTAVGLQKLAGIGPYTAGAIASISFGEVVPAIDGNAFRVFARLLEIDADIAKPQTRHLFEEILQPIVSPTRPGDFNQAIMDLGSSYMSAANPDSAHSPVRAFNQAYLDGVEESYPVKTKKPRPVLKRKFGLVIEVATSVLLTKRPSKGMLADLWAFPLISEETVTEFLEKQPKLTIVEALNQIVADEYGLKVQFDDADVKDVTHTFTHQKWQIKLYRAELQKAPDLSNFPGKLVSQTDLNDLPIPKVQVKLFAAFDKERVNR
ncbi:A/G-specific adenine glycosylase [Secundilactobacillus malefermentans]|uniref:Adenine DNA glycosylase n=1 Tax=Secundilactobacillus malefermentans TaxID=176292 RepID=A0A4R5NK79_9LACO|nr:A/G-specific adenine glycosylase [Secundilactobacillus malefermentans]QEA31228.1 A/G-specific adenine glycosylase [Secundilactobacillus malefermentans]TDG75066.1 hypothetical protein C5L31_001696 [Secundilactobacillus malefermentans]